MSSSDSLMTPDDVAAYLQMPVEFVNDELKEGRLHHILIGGQVRIHARELDRYIGQEPGAEVQSFLPKYSPVERSVSFQWQRVAAISLLILGSLYSLYVIILEYQAGAFDGDPLRGVGTVILSLILSPAWILPGGFYWLVRLERKEQSRV